MRTAGYRLGGLALLLALAFCATPGREYSISPVLHGHLAGVEPDGVTLEFVVRSRTTSTLGARATTVIDGDGVFRFEPITLELAGLEFDKLYNAYLYVWNPKGEPLVIWRAEWRRGDTPLPIQLDCDLDRPAQQGQRCRVEHGVDHHWLVWHGELEFERLCASCHGVGAAPPGPAAAALSTPPPDLRRIAARRSGRFDRAAIIAWIDGRSRSPAHGSSEMPVWGPRLAGELNRYSTAEDMAAARIDAIVVYLESMQRPVETETETEAEAGAE